MSKAMTAIDCRQSPEVRLWNGLCEQPMVGDSATLEAVLRQAEIVGPTDSTVLVLGETGTGKGLIANMIHGLSPRRHHSFVKLNCAAIPLGLLESELFGHERGAFTGAIVQRIGRFEAANKGTLFLDEIGDIPPELQPKLLRVLQEHEFERLGSTQTVRTDVRLIAATHRNMRKMVAEGKFRSDLFYRLNVFPLTMPPLRERREDIPLLVRHFVQVFARQMNKKIEVIPTAAVDSLAAYSWPGNIREFRELHGARRYSFTGRGAGSSVGRTYRTRRGYTNPAGDIERRGTGAYPAHSARSERSDRRRGDSVGAPAFHAVLQNETPGDRRYASETARKRAAEHIRVRRGPRKGRK